MIIHKSISRSIKLDMAFNDIAIRYKVHMNELYRDKTPKTKFFKRKN